MLYIVVLMRMCCLYVVTFACIHIYVFECVMRVKKIENTNFPSSSLRSDIRLDQIKANIVTILYAQCTQNIRYITAIKSKHCASYYAIPWFSMCYEFIYVIFFLFASFFDEL